MKQELSVVPNLVNEEQIAYIINLAKEAAPEFYERENRHRFVFDWNADPIFKQLAETVCEQLNATVDELEYGVQVFIHHEGGQTFYHTDALSEANGKRRNCTALVYLNDDYLGSYLDFPYLGSRIKPQRGMMIAYPLTNENNEMNETFGHSASMITKGTKYMCVYTILEEVV
jgi:hypothetical protein